MFTQLKKIGSAALVSGALRQSAVATVGNIVTGVVSAVAIILASRILGPTQFGVFSVASSLIAVGSKIGDWGLNSIVTRFLPRSKDDFAQSRPLLAQLVQWKLAATLIGAAVLLFFGPQFREWLRFPYPVAWLAIVVGAVVLAGYEYVYLILSALHEFVWLGFFGVIQAVLKMAAFTGLWVVGLQSATSITLAYAIAPLASIVLIFRHLKRWLLISPATADKALRRQIMRFAPHASVGVVSMALISNIDLLLVQTRLSPFETGLYAGAGRISLFIALIAASVGGVLNNRVVRYQDRSTRIVYLKKSAVLFLAAGLGFLIFLPLARLVLVMTIGPEYLSGLPTLIVLVGNAFLGLAIIPYISFFYSVDKPAYFSIGGLIQVASIVVITLILMPRYGLISAAYARLAATMILGLFTGWNILAFLRTKDRLSSHY
jgi:O-antigen/teichoic acid export membrane protein